MDERQSFAARFHFTFRLLMIPLYLLAGIALIITSSNSTLPFTNRKLVGGILILYAAYRAYLMYRKNHQKDKTETTNDASS
jgi:hypothetical protein